MTRSLFAIISFVFMACSANADNFALEREKVTALGKLIAPPNYVDADGFEAQGDEVARVIIDELQKR